MKNELIILSLVTLSCICGCTDDMCEKMTDIEFKQYCLENFDVNHDGKLSKIEAEAVLNIDCSTAEDFAGIECFSNLLSFKSTSVKHVDLRHNKGLISLYMSEGGFDNKDRWVGAPIEKLDLSNNINLTYIGAHEFSYCYSLTSIVLPESLTGIGKYAFSFCHSLTTITLPKELTDIGELAFLRCSNLTSVTLPKCLASICMGAFWYCENLSSVKVLSATPPSLEDDAFGHIGSSAILYVPPESIETYRKSDWVKYFTEILPL